MHGKSRKTQRKRLIISSQALSGSKKHLGKKKKKSSFCVVSQSILISLAFLYPLCGDTQERFSSVICHYANDMC